MAATSETGRRTPTRLSGDEVLAALHHAVLALDHGGVLLHANPAAARLLRRPPRHLLGRHFVAHVDVECRPAVQTALARAAAGEATTQLACSVGTLGAPTWLEVDVAPAPHGSVVLAREATSAERQARETDTATARAHSFAHDFNNLLCAITGYTDLVLLQPDVAPCGRELLAEIKKAGDRAAALTLRLLHDSHTDPDGPTAVPR